MKFRSIFKTFFALALLAGSISAFAETVWLSDVLRVNVRTEPSSSAQRLSTISSGTRMEVLGKSEDNNFYNIRTEDGLEGWVPRQYLVTEPTGNILAANLEAEKKQLQQKLDELDKKYTALLGNKGDVSGELETLRTNNAELTKELNRIKAISENAITLDSQYQELAEEHARIKNEFDVLKAENTSLKEDNDSQMMYIGGILIIVGIILGVILPRLSSKRRKDGWS